MSGHRTLEQVLDSFANGERWAIRKAYTIDSGMILYAVIDDVELDLFRVEFDFEGIGVSINTSQASYILLSADQLNLLADLTREASDIYDDWHKSPAHKAWSEMDSGDEEASKAAEAKYRALVNVTDKTSDPWLGEEAMGTDG